MNLIHLAEWYSFGMIWLNGGRMRIFLGIDGGGSGCRAVIGDDAGHVIGRGEAGPANIVSDPEGARANILTAARMALGNAGKLEDLHAVLGLAGGNLAAAAQALAAQLPFASARVLWDAQTAAEGALAGRDGIVAALGTGSVFARRVKGDLRMTGGWGLAVGDEGSGAWLGRAMMSRALWAHDGLIEMTPFLRDLLDDMGGAEAMAGFAASARPVDFAQHARRMLERPEDSTVQALLGEAESWVLRQIEHLQPEAARLPVCFTGGLGPIFAARLGDRLGVDLLEPRGTGLDGALMLARAGGVT